ncbi:STAS domain-containing protein [Rhodoblastus acidophilus]|uniref:STAS domain-containing protein n=1 Tax=Rhodoblastus acidophilus TaxID=1074 RepID=UPI0022257D77|nr:STAS domain-containing protein [Rhodoblastus acidophilus]MCW2286065.1 hypothetical protein [Rhodoblastus acidophilus]
MNSGNASVCLSEDLTIRNIQNVQRDLLERLAGQDSLELVVEDEAKVDLSFVQLLMAARPYAQSQGKTVRLARPAAGNLRRVLERAGALSRPTPDAARFWLHEEHA